MSAMEWQFPGDVRQALAGSRRNVSEIEQWLSLLAAAGLLVYGLSRRDNRGWMAAAIGASLLERGVTGHCRLFDAVGLNTASSGGDTRRALGGPAGVIVEERVIINRPRGELYRFWRNLENLPRFMRHLESVERLTDTLSRWRAKGPAGISVEWNAEIINEVEEKAIGWRSLEGSDVVSAGSVNFEDAGGGRATRLRVRLQYSPPGGKLGDAFARLFGRDAATEIRADLQRFKQLVESGELSTR